MEREGAGLPPETNGCERKRFVAVIDQVHTSDQAHDTAYAAAVTTLSIIHRDYQDVVCFAATRRKTSRTIAPWRTRPKLAISYAEASAAAISYSKAGSGGRSQRSC